MQIYKIKYIERIIDNFEEDYTFNKELISAESEELARNQFLLNYQTNNINIKIISIEKYIEQEIYQGIAISERGC